LVEFISKNIDHIVCNNKMFLGEFGKKLLTRNKKQDDFYRMIIYKENNKTNS